MGTWRFPYAADAGQISSMQSHATDRSGGRTTCVNRRDGLGRAEREDQKPKEGQIQAWRGLDLRRRVHLAISEYCLRDEEASSELSASP